MEPQNQTKKRLGITHGELLTASIVIISAILMFWKTTDVRLSALELRMDMVETAKAKSDELINNKLDKLQESINDVKVSLSNKQDKK